MFIVTEGRYVKVRYSILSTFVYVWKISLKFFNVQINKINHITIQSERYIWKV